MNDGDTDRMHVPPFDDTDVVIISRVTTELDDTDDLPIPPPRRASTLGDWPPEPRQPARPVRRALVYRIVTPFVQPRD